MLLRGVEIALVDQFELALSDGNDARLAKAKAWAFLVVSQLMVDKGVQILVRACLVEVSQ